MSFNIININFEKIILKLSDIFKRKNKFDKSNLRILFIDDQIDDFPVVQNLKNANWSVETMKEIESINDEKIANSQIIFVDYKGVGRKLAEKDQGLGIIKLLKEEYGDTKRVILYSAYHRFSVEIIDGCYDNHLLKNSDTGKFIEMIKDEKEKLK